MADTASILRPWTGPTWPIIAEYDYPSFVHFAQEYFAWQDSRPEGLWKELNQTVVVDDSEFL